MDSHKILIPVCHPQFMLRKIRRLCRLVSERPAEFYLVDIQPAQSPVQRLIGFLTDRQARRREQVEEARRLILYRELMPCHIEEVHTSDIAASIVQATWQMKPDVLILASELLDRLNQIQLRDLASQLNGISQRVVLLLADGSVVKLESATKNRLIPAVPFGMLTATEG